MARSVRSGRSGRSSQRQSVRPEVAKNERISLVSIGFHWISLNSMDFHQFWWKSNLLLGISCSLMAVQGPKYAGTTLFRDQGNRGNTLEIHYDDWGQCCIHNGFRFLLQNHDFGLHTIWPCSLKIKLILGIIKFWKFCTSDRSTDDPQLTIIHLYVSKIMALGR